MNTEEAKELAEQHWLWLERLLHEVYVGAMVHGIKHGTETNRPPGVREYGELLSYLREPPPRVHHL